VDIRQNIETGWPSGISLHQRISAYIRDGRARSFKVGITNNPYARAANYGSEYDEMILVYETSSDKNLREVERILTAYYTGWSDNRNDGGGGRRGDGPYYVYVVLRR